MDQWGYHVGTTPGGRDAVPVEQVSSRADKQSSSGKGSLMEREQSYQGKVAIAAACCREAHSQTPAPAPAYVLPPGGRDAVPVEQVSSRADKQSSLR